MFHQQKESFFCSGQIQFAKSKFISLVLLMHRRYVEGEGKNCEILWVQRIAVDVAAESPKQSISTNTSNVDKQERIIIDTVFFWPTKRSCGRTTILCKM